MESESGERHQKFFSSVFLLPCIFSPLSNKRPSFAGKKVNKSRPLPFKSPSLSPCYPSLINDSKTSCALIRDGICNS